MDAVPPMPPDQRVESLVLKVTGRRLVLTSKPRMGARGRPRTDAGAYSADEVAMVERFLREVLPHPERSVERATVPPTKDPLVFASALANVLRHGMRTSTEASPYRALQRPTKHGDVEHSFIALWLKLAFAEISTTGDLAAAEVELFAVEARVTGLLLLGLASRTYVDALLMCRTQTRAREILGPLARLFKDEAELCAIYGVEFEAALDAAREEAVLELGPSDHGAIVSRISLDPRWKEHPHISTLMATLRQQARDGDAAAQRAIRRAKNERGLRRGQPRSLDQLLLHWMHAWSDPGVPRVEIVRRVAGLLDDARIERIEHLNQHFTSVTHAEMWRGALRALRDWPHFPVLVRRSVLRDPTIE